MKITSNFKVLLLLSLILILFVVLLYNTLHSSSVSADLVVLSSVPLGKTHQLVIDWLQKFRPDSSSEEREAIHTGLVKKTNISYEKYQLSDKFINEFKSNYSKKGIKAPSDVYSDYKNHKRWRKHHLIQIDRIRNILLNMKNQINEK